MAYDYDTATGLKELDRITNPLGFQVLSYRVETEY
jgi:type IV secretory pathway component VirB8